MLHTFLTTNRDELIRRCHEKSAKRFAPSPSSIITNHGVPLFLRQVIEILRLEHAAPGERVSSAVAARSHLEVGRAAALHGADLMRLGFSIEHVVREYGDVCQSVTDLAVELHATIPAEDFRTLNRCLDDAIADAVSAFAVGRGAMVNREAQHVLASQDAFAAEQGRLVDIATQAYLAIRTGSVGLTGATGTLLLHTLAEMGKLLERALPGMRAANEAVALPDL